MVLELLEEILPHVEASIYPSRIPIPEWKIKEGEIPGAHARSFKDKSWASFKIPGSWGRNDKTFWFRSSVAPPAKWSGMPIALLVDIPEGLVYVDGEPYQGVDVNHGEIILAPKTRTGHVFQFAIEAYSGRKNDLNKFHRSEIAVLDTNAKALFNSLVALRDLDALMEHGSSESKNIRELIRRTLIFLKYFKPGSEEYPNAIGRAYSFLVSTVSSEPQSPLPGLVHLIGQSHLDVVWLWKMSQTERKCGRTFSTALRLMEEYPEFKFVQSQAALYGMAKDNYPSLFKQIKQRVTEGRWEPVGSTLVEPDCNIPNGESLVRQILYGKRFFKTEFGVESNIFWIPDSFGFSWSLPQILRKSGIEYFFTTKLAWNDTNKFPYNTFWWQGLDGTRVLAHQPPVGLEGSVTPKDLLKSWEGFAQKEQQSTHVAQTFGFGDGGGGPTHAQVEFSRVLKNNSGIPQCTLSTAREFFAEAIQQADAIPTWNSELYLEKHRGTYTTHGWIKRANRLAERDLYNAELLSVLGKLHGESTRSRLYPHREIAEAWRTILINQFHDIVTGTSIQDGLDDARKGYERATEITTTISQRALGGLTRRTPATAREFHFTFFNTMAWTRNDYVEIEVKSASKYYSVTDSAGSAIEYQVLSTVKGVTRLLCYVENGQPFSFLTLTVKPSETPPPTSDAWEFSPKNIETPLYRLRIDGKGFFSSIYDKSIRKELLEKGRRGNVFQTFKDTPKQWDAWDIDADFERQHVDLLTLKKHQIIESGPLRAIVHNVFVSRNGSEIAQDLILYHKRPQLAFNTRVRWKEKQTLLKVAFPFNVKTNQATYETQFGAITRSSKHKSDLERAQFEVPAQQWADLSDAKFGVSLLNDCKYGYDARDNTLRLTLLRSPFYPHPTEPWRFNDVRHTDQGEHLFSYALAPHVSNWKQGESTRKAREFNNPLIPVENSIGNAFKPLVTINKKNIFVDAVKKAEDSDDIILRLHESHGDSSDATLVFGFKPKAAFECDLMEQDQKPLKPRTDKLQLKFKPFEIKTIRIVLRGGTKK